MLCLAPAKAQLPVPAVGVPAAKVPDEETLKMSELAGRMQGAVLKKAPAQGMVRVGAVCADTTLSLANGSGACSGHGGVAWWVYRHTDSLKNPRARLVLVTKADDRDYRRHGAAVGDDGTAHGHSNGTWQPGPGATYAPPKGEEAFQWEYRMLIRFSFAVLLVVLVAAVVKWVLK